MSFRSMLDHKVYLSRDVDAGTEDAYGHPDTTTETGELFPAAIQPKSAREMALITQAGVPIADHTIYCRPRVVSQGDAVIHDTELCPKPDNRDLPTLRFELSGVRNAAGRGHHLTLDARAIGTTAGVEGS